MATLAASLPAILGADDESTRPGPNVVAALGRLAMQFRDSPNLRSVIAALAAQNDDLAEAHAQIALISSIEDSFGVQLDNLGAIVGEPRQGFSDLEYRPHLRARVMLNNGSGTIEDILHLFKQVVGSDVTVELTEQVPAAVTVRLGGAAIDSTLSRYLVNFLALAHAAGVKAILEWSGLSDADSFWFDGGIGKGFDDGVFASARYA